MLEPRLILAEGDGRGKEAKRLFLLDMPGWNSYDEMDNRTACSANNSLGKNMLRSCS